MHQSQWLRASRRHQPMHSAVAESRARSATTLRCETQVYSVVPNGGGVGSLARAESDRNCTSSARGTGRPGTSAWGVWGCASSYELAASQAAAALASVGGGGSRPGDTAGGGECTGGNTGTSTPVAPAASTAAAAAGTALAVAALAVGAGVDGPGGAGGSAGRQCIFQSLSLRQTRPGPQYCRPDTKTSEGVQALAAPAQRPHQEPSGMQGLKHSVPKAFGGGSGASEEVTTGVGGGGEEVGVGCGAACSRAACCCSAACCATACSCAACCCSASCCCGGAVGAAPLSTVPLGAGASVPSYETSSTSSSSGCAPPAAGHAKADCSISSRTNRDNIHARCCWFITSR